MSRDRGQLLLVGAIGLAIILVALALALNTAVVGELSAAQAGQSVSEERAVIHFVDGVERGIGGLLPLAYSGDVDYDEVEAAFETDVERWHDLASVYDAADGAFTTVSILDIEVGSRVIQNESSTFTAHDGSEHWTLAEDVSEIDSFNMTVTNESLVTSDDCVNDGCFSLNVSDGVDDWSLTIWTPNASTDNLRVSVTTANGSVDTCSTTNTSVEINVTDGVVDDGAETCNFTPFTDDVALDSPYSISYAHGANVSGTYEAHFPERIASPSIRDDPRYDTRENPRVDPTVRATEVQVTYRSPSVTFDTSRDLEVADD